MIKTIRVMLRPNNKQSTRLFANAGVARFVYNWALSFEKLNYDIGNDFLSEMELRRVLTRDKANVPRLQFLNMYSVDVQKQAVKDAVKAYVSFFKGKAKFPRFKSRRRSKPSFYMDTSKIKFTDTHVKLSKIAETKRANRSVQNWVRLAECGRIPTDCSYYNPRVTFDGLNWWITVGVEYEPSKETEPSSTGIGIDLGIKTLAVCSDGNVYPNINKTKKVIKLNKRKKHIQRQLSRKYIKNKKGGCYCETNNIKKAKKKFLKLSRRINNIRQNHMHQATSEIVNRKPKFIVLEDLNVTGMMKNKHLAKAVQEQNFAEFRRQIVYKAARNGVRVIIANRYFPSSKLCSSCGFIHKGLKLTDRTYVCPVCGHTIDRDYQASVNLCRYELTV